MHRPIVLGLIVLLIGSCAAARPQPGKTASDVNATVAAAQPGDIPADEPSLHCIGLRWFIRGDANHNAVVNVSYRKVGTKRWHKAMRLFRAESAAMEDRRPPEGVTLLAGSIFDLEPNTRYRVRLTLTDPDGGSAERMIYRTTWAEPVAPAPKRTLRVIPDQDGSVAGGGVAGGGVGSRGDPIRGLAAACSAARPGDLLLLAPGTYAGPLKVRTDGTAEAPIVFRGSRQGESIIKGPADGTAVIARKRKYVYFERLAIRGARQAMAVDGADHLVIRRCTMTDVLKGISDDQSAHRLFIADNVLTGRRAYGAKLHVEDRAIELSGTGHMICYNRISRFKDAIDTRMPWPVRDIDINNNDCSECGDDGIELDFSEQNVRAYDNRLTNCALGISFQPSRGGPNYAVRNILYNIRYEAFKFHLTPTNRGQADWKTGPHRTSGGVIIHNTVIKKDSAIRTWSDEGPVHHFYARNNLLVGSPAYYCIEITPPMRYADWDYDVYVDETMTKFALWNEHKYDTIEQFRQATGLEKHGKVVRKFAGVFVPGVVLPDPAVASPVSSNRPALAEASPAVDAGEVLANINDGFVGKAPDAGAWERGGKVPHYGPRPE